MSCGIVHRCSSDLVLLWLWCSDGMSNGMYASSDPLAGGGFADHGVFLAVASPLRYAIPKYVGIFHH